MTERLKQHLFDPDFSDDTITAVRDNEWDREVGIAVHKLDPTAKHPLSYAQVIDISRARIAELIMVAGLRNFSSAVRSDMNLEVMEKPEGSQMEIGGRYYLGFHSPVAAHAYEKNAKLQKAEFDAVATNGPDLYVFDATTSRNVESNKSCADSQFRSIRQSIHASLRQGIREESPFRDIHKVHIVFSRHKDEMKKPLVCKEGISIIRIPFLRSLLDDLTETIVQRARTALGSDLLQRAS